MSETMDTATINGVTYNLVPVEIQSQHRPGEPFTGITVSWLTYPEYGLEYAGEVKEVKPGMWFESEKDRIGLYYTGAYETKFGLREILRPRTKPALPPPDSEYWTHDVFGIQTVFSWEDEPRSINVMERGSTHGYVWQPNGRSWLDRVLSKGYDWRTLHIAPKGYFDKDGG